MKEMPLNLNLCEKIFVQHSLTSEEAIGLYSFDKSDFNNIGEVEFVVIGGEYLIAHHGTGDDEVLELFVTGGENESFWCQLNDRGKSL